MVCLLTNRSYVLENQNTLSSEAIMSSLSSIGDYELLKKQNEVYKEEAKQLDIESGLTSIKHAVEIPMRWY